MATEEASTTDVSQAAVTGAVRKVGTAAIKTMQLGDLTVFCVSGRQDQSTSETLERTILRARGNVALDLRTLQGPERKLVSMLRRVARLYEEQRRVFLIFEPTSRLIDQLTLQGVLGEVSLYDSKRGLLRRSAGEPVEAAGAEAVGLENQIVEASHRVIRFTQSFERVEQIETALATAGKRSRAMFQTGAPEFPPFEIVSQYLPHDELGGDFFQLERLDDDHLGIAIGDVSGHGVEAALIMGMTKKVLEIRARDGSHTDPAAVIRTTNQDLFPDLDRYTFVTALYAILERSTGTLTYARAGHNYPLLVSPSRNCVSQLNGPGIALGMDNGELFNGVLKSMREPLQPGDLLVFFTDGLVEAAHDKRGPFGVERLVQCFRELAIARPLEEVRDMVLAAVRSHIGDSRFADDVTLILIRHAG